MTRTRGFKETFAGCGTDPRQAILPPGGANTKTGPGIPCWRLPRLLTDKGFPAVSEPASAGAIGTIIPQTSVSATAIMQPIRMPTGTTITAFARRGLRRLRRGIVKNGGCWGHRGNLFIKHEA